MQMPAVRFAGENGFRLFPAFQLSDATHTNPTGNILDSRLLPTYAVRGLRLREPKRPDFASEPDRSGLAPLFPECCERLDVGADGLDQRLLHLGAECPVLAFVHRAVPGFHEDVSPWLVGERVSAGDAFVP